MALRLIVGDGDGDGGGDGAVSDRTDFKERADSHLAACAFCHFSQLTSFFEDGRVRRARVAEILAPDVALYRDAQRLWQTYKDAFGGGNATVPEGAAGRRAGRRSERRAAQQMLRQRRRVVGEG